MVYHLDSRSTFSTPSFLSPVAGERKEGAPTRQRLYDKTCFHFAAVSARSCGVSAWSLEKFFSQRNGRQASMMARELVKSPCWRRSGGILGSMGLLQHPRMISIDVSGSHLVAIAHRTSATLDGSISSSTTITKRPKYPPSRAPRAT